MDKIGTASLTRPAVFLAMLLAAQIAPAQETTLQGDILTLPTIVLGDSRYHVELRHVPEPGPLRFTLLSVAELSNASALGGSFYVDGNLLISRIVLDDVPYWARLSARLDASFELTAFGIYEYGLGSNSVGLSRDPNWLRLPGDAIDIGVGANGDVWVLGVDERSGGFGIYNWTGDTWRRVQGGAVRIDVGPDGRPWIINDTHQIYRWSGSDWQRLPGEARDIGVGANGAVWVVSGGGIYEWNGIDWDRTSGSAVRVDVAPDGVPWVIDQSDDIYELVDRRWIRRPGEARDIGIGADGSVWIIGSSDEEGGHDVYRWLGQQWRRVPGSARQISVDQAGAPWVLTSDGDIYRSQ